MSLLRRRREKRPSSERSLIERLDVLIGERRRSVVVLAICSIISGFAEAGTLALIAVIGESLVTSKKPIHVHLAGLGFHPRLWTVIVIAFGLAMIRLAMQFPLSILPARIAADVQATLRTRLLGAYTNASWELQSRDREGQFQETITGQTLQATGGALAATNLIVNALNFLTLIVLAFLLNPIAAGGIMVGGALMFAAVKPLKNIGVRRARSLSKAQVRFAAGINEAVRLSEETHVFGVAAAQRERINGLIDRARKFLFEVQVLNKFVPNLFQSLILLLLLAGLAVWTALKVGNNASIAIILLLLVRSARSGQQGVSTVQSLSQSLPFIERTQEAERRYLEHAEREGSMPLESVETLEFEDVGYGYRPERLALSGVSFSVRRGEVVGVIGPTGAGKSTLIQLLLQLRSPQLGRYLVNGADAGDYRREDWQRRVVYVPQEPRLLHASVADNIRFERSIELADIERAAQLAHIHEEITTWTKGYETVVGPRADAVSGGQQQRLCLARALVGRPEVLVLDEPTSALDPNSEARIQESLTGLKKEQQVTMFIIAHRMSTLDICDRVMVILDGKLVAFDTIEELRAHNAYYRTASAIATGIR